MQCFRFIWRKWAFSEDSPYKIGIPNLEGWGLSRFECKSIYPPGVWEGGDSRGVQGKTAGRELRSQEPVARLPPQPDRASPKRDGVLIGLHSPKNIRGKIMIIKI